MTENTYKQTNVWKKRFKDSTHISVKYGEYLESFMKDHGPITTIKHRSREQYRNPNTMTNMAQVGDYKQN